MTLAEMFANIPTRDGRLKAFKASHQKQATMTLPAADSRHYRAGSGICGRCSTVMAQYRQAGRRP